MARIGQRTAVGDRPHKVTLQNPGPPVPDGDGGFTTTWTDLDPVAVFAKIEPATAQTLERLAPGTAISSATHVVSMPYHSGVTTKTRITHEGRRFEVTGVASPEERKADTIAIWEEVVG